MNLCSELCLSVCPAVWPSILRGKNLNVGHYRQTFQPNLFIPAMLTGTIDFCHFTPFYWPWPCQGVTRSALSKACLLHFFPHFSSEQDEIWCGDEAIQAEHHETLTNICGKMGMTAVLLTVSKKLSCWNAFEYLRINFIQTWYDGRYYCTVQFDTSLFDLDFDSRSQENEKAKTSAPVISQSFQSVWMEFGLLLRLVRVMNLILLLLCSCNIQGREPYLCDFITKTTLTLAYIQAFTDKFLSDLAWWQKPPNSTFCYQFGRPGLSFRITVVWEINNFVFHFRTNLGIDSDEIQYGAATCWFVETHAKFILCN